MSSDGASSGWGDWGAVLGKVVDAGVQVVSARDANKTQVELARAKAGAATAGVQTPTFISMPVGSSGAAQSPAVQANLGSLNLSGLTMPLLLLGGLLLAWKIAT